LPKKFARQYGLELEDDVPEIFLTEAELHETFGVRSWARTVAVDVWASQVSRRWPGDRFLELAGLLRTAGWKVIEVGRHSGTRIPAWRSFLNQLTVRQTAAVLSRCGLYIGNDSGLFHLAAAVGTPQVAVFGTVPPARRLYWSTVGVKSDHLCPKACEGAVTCSEAPQGSRCLPEISAAKVMHAVEVAARRHGIT
jgi:ADP-heptose:LPS heptosyltransferase